MFPTMGFQLKVIQFVPWLCSKSKLFFTTNNKEDIEKKIYNATVTDDLLKSHFAKISEGKPPRAKLNKVIVFLTKSDILNTKWTHLEVIDEIYKRRIDNDLLFHLNVLYGLGSKGMHLNKKALVSPTLFLPLLDFDQFRYIVRIIQLADKERKLKLHEQKEHIEKFFKQ